MKIEVCLRVLAENKWITKNYQKKEILVHVLKRIKREKIIFKKKRLMVVVPNLWIINPVTSLLWVQKK